MNRLLNKKLWVAVIVMAIAATLVALPSIGEDSEHQDLNVVTIEAKILNNNVAVKRAELALELQQDELDDAIANKSDAGSNAVESAKNRRYYPKQADLNFYLAEKNLADIKQSEILSGTEMYYNYLLLLKEIGQQNNRLVRLNNELSAVNKKIELGTATLNARTTKALEISKANYALTQLKDQKESLFLDMNLTLQQDLETVLVMEDVSIPFEKFADADLVSDLEFVLATNKDLWKLEKQNELDVIELDIYEDNNSKDTYDSSIAKLKSTLNQNTLDIADKKLSLEYDVRSTYNGVLNKYDSVVIKELELENLALTLDTLTKRFEVGFETQNTLDVATENVAAAELDLLQAKLDYYIAMASYKNFIN